jgi:pyruvate-formate lyase
MATCDTALRPTAQFWVPPATPERAARWLDLAFRITAEHQAALGQPVPVREGRCLRLQVAVWFDPPTADELLAGAACLPPIGISPEPGGYGWYCQEDRLRAAADAVGLDAAGRERLEGVFAYWRPLASPTLTRPHLSAATCAALPALRVEELLSRRGAAFPIYRLCGCQIDYQQLLSLGLPGLAARIAAERQRKAGDATAQAFFAGAELALAAIADALAWLAAEADRAGLADQAATCRAVIGRAPQTLREAIQLHWVYSVASGVLNYGRLDDDLGGFLAADLAAGRLDDDGALALVRSHWRLINDRGTVVNSRVMLGGLGRRDPAAADRFALVALRAHELERQAEPQLSMRLAPEQDPRLEARALDLIGQGLTFPILYNDVVNVPAVAKAMRVSEDEAVHYLPYGCGEYILNHRSTAAPNGVIQAARVLEEVMFGLPAGSDATPAATDPAQWPRFASVAALWDAFAERTHIYLEAMAEVQDLSYAIPARHASWLLLSVLYDDCIGRGRAILDGGVRYRGGTMELYGSTNAADAFTAIETVLDAGQADLDAVRSALVAEWKGHEALRARLSRAPKYGNDDARADRWYSRVHELVCHGCRDRGAPHHLDYYLVVTINNSFNVLFGLNQWATPDGRASGAALANANGPAPGADVSGPSAVLASQAKPDPAIHAGTVQNLRLAPRWFAGDRRDLRALLGQYWSAGGTQLMITVNDARELAAAVERPQDYGHLMVRVGGFSARFVDLPRHTQIEIAGRSLH